MTNRSGRPLLVVLPAATSPCEGGGRMPPCVRLISTRWHPVAGACYSQRDGAIRSVCALVWTRSRRAVSGHTPDGSPTRASHLAIAPLAFTGYPHADGRVFGFALIPSAQMVLGDVPGLRAAFEKVAPYDSGAERRVLELRCVPHQPLQLSPAGESSKRSLMPGPYLRPARVWASVTPVVLDRHLKGYDEGKIRELIADSCANGDRRRAAGVAAPWSTAVDALACSGGTAQPAADPRRHRLRGGRAGDARCRAVHGARALSPARRDRWVMALPPADFAAFFCAIHGHDPFSWQQRLVEQLASTNRWPERAGPADRQRQDGSARCGGVPSGAAGELPAAQRCELSWW